MSGLFCLKLPWPAYNFVLAGLAMTAFLFFLIIRWIYPDLFYLCLFNLMGGCGFLFCFFCICLFLIMGYNHNFCTAGSSKFLFCVEWNICDTVLMLQCRRIQARPGNRGLACGNPGCRVEECGRGGIKEEATECRFKAMNSSAANS